MLQFNHGCRGGNVSSRRASDHSRDLRRVLESLTGGTNQLMQQNKT